MRADPEADRAYIKAYYELNKPRILAYQKAYAERRRQEMPEHVLALARERRARHYAKHKDRLLAAEREERRANPEAYRARRREFWRQANEEYRRTAREWSARLRAEMIEAYGGECACCGENAHSFLALDHVNRDGRAHRLSLAKRGGSGGRSRDVYLDLKRRGWPKDGYRLACVNCNFATRYGDPCPHEIEALAGMDEVGRK